MPVSSHRNCSGWVAWYGHWCGRIWIIGWLLALSSVAGCASVGSDDPEATAEQNAGALGGCSRSGGDQVASSRESFEQTMARLQLTPDVPYVDGAMKAHIEGLDAVTALVETDERYASYRGDPSSLTADAMYEIERLRYGVSGYRSEIEFLSYVPLAKVSSTVDLDRHTQELKVVPGGDVGAVFDRHNSFPLATAPPLSIYGVGRARDIVRQHFLVRLPVQEYAFLAFKSRSDAEVFVQMQRVRHDVREFADWVFWQRWSIEAYRFLVHRVLEARPDLDPNQRPHWQEAVGLTNGYLIGRYLEGRLHAGWLLGDVRYFYPSERPNQVNAYVRRVGSVTEAWVLDWVRQASPRTDLRITVVETTSGGSPYSAKLTIAAANDHTPQ
jgi:hypothetical protein